LPVSLRDAQLLAQPLCLAHRLKLCKGAY
jgi:hypothetical protein